LNFNLQISSNLNGHIQVSTNLTSWATLTNFVGTNTTLNFRDPAATNSNQPVLSGRPTTKIIWRATVIRPRMAGRTSFRSGKLKSGNRKS
jgi:hypothetical protein